MTITTRDERVAAQINALLPSLQRIVEDASRATAADEIALAKERPVFERLLDPDIPQFPGFKRVGKGWPKGKPRGKPYTREEC